MAEPLKLFFSPALVRRLAADVRRAHAGFPVSAFVRQAYELTKRFSQPRDRLELHTSISLAVHTARKPHSGRHAVDVIVNGKAQRIGSFEVVAARPRKNDAR
jgi:hypothetical protein